MSERGSVALVSLWYFPSHFGLHVDDFAAAFEAAGYEVLIVTVSELDFQNPVFDSSRHMFLEPNRQRRSAARLNALSIQDRQDLMPSVRVEHDEIYNHVLAWINQKAAHVLHFFEALLPDLIIPFTAGASDCSVLYTGDFVTRILGTSADRLLQRRLLTRMFGAHAEVLSDGTLNLHGVDTVLVQTKSLAEALQVGVLRTPVYYISSLVPVEDVISAPAGDLRADLVLPQNSRVLLYAGRPTKNAHVLPRLLREVRARPATNNACLALIGTQNVDINEWPNVREQREVIRELGFAERPLLYSYLKSADVLVYPSVVDGHAKIVGESQAAGLPVVAFRGPATSIEEIIEDGSTGLLVEANDVEGFTQAVSRVLIDDHLRSSIVTQARAAVFERAPAAFVNRIERIWETHQRKSNQLNSADDRT